MNFDELLQKAKETAKAAVGIAEKQTERVVEFSRLKIEQTKLNGELARLYEELGQATYNAMKNEEDCSETMDILCDEIELIINDLDDLEEIINEKRNIKFCPSCGAKVSKDSYFCSKCGAVLVEDDDDDDEEFDAEEISVEEAAAEEADVVEAVPEETAE